MIDAAGLDHPAIFGKLPGHGDFISRGLSGDLRSVIDHWLSDWLAAARADRAETFESDYEVAAPWLFEGANVTAVLLPSMDAVGRRFPLLVLTAPDRMTQSVYDAMVEALLEGTSADDLRGALAALAASAPQSGRKPRWFLPDGAEQLLPMPDSVGSWPSVEGCFV
ncbi:type VI secretion system-associated protein TagF [Porphyrobacter sp. AAP60]|uniref:type VI secretion system-associated protein TagF n=1 Tax=Porphyrobacter sp. AAP60 TaxID=1523423 RepID=UPI000AF5091E|nr:type VI secretion system-associated protein TagF [Porphyrobacter sp. AAP60]